MKSFTITILALTLITAACSKSSDKPSNKSEPTKTEPTKTEPPKGDGHADKNVVPGSHEDWCDEHAVPESQCTRCNPDLIAAFKATKDWCEEHGLPESQCTKCNPNIKIERPAKK